MAQKVSITLTDDIDGTEAAETLTFALDGINYEIDLSSKNAAKFREGFGKYVGAARRIGKATGKAGKRTQIGPSPREVREWATSNGMEVPARGRIPAEVMDAFNSATK